MTKLNQYEAMFLLGPKGSAEPEASINLCKGIIERHGGQMILIKKWDERKLAYEVNKNKRGTYIVAFFRAVGPEITPIERDAKLNEDILRIMVLRVDHLNEAEMSAVEPQPIIREEKPMGVIYGMGERPPYDMGAEMRPSRRPRRDEAEMGAKD
jgi:small subunit ribosomal protein S6